MSWEAWGSGDEFDGPEGYVTEEYYDEMKAERDLFLTLLLPLAHQLPADALREVAANTVADQVEPVSPDAERLLKPIREELMREVCAPACATVVDGCVVHGDEPLTDEGRAAVSALIGAARKRAIALIDDTVELGL